MFTQPAKLQKKQCGGVKDLSPHNRQNSKKAVRGSVFLCVCRFNNNLAQMALFRCCFLALFAGLVYLFTVVPNEGQQLVKFVAHILFKIIEIRFFIFYRLASVDILKK